MTTDKRNPESGYALLLIFAMAAVIAISLYSQVPRVAFEAQRDKEQLLVDRGQEYQRAVTLFVRKFNRFPSTMEELDNTNTQRFLRRHFTDPMTGKADWRILHAGPGGVITDSVTSVKQTEGSSMPTGFITDLGNMVGGTVVTRSDGVNLATRQRPSDQSGGSFPTSTSGDGGNSTPASSGPIPGYNGPVMVLPDGRIVPANSTGAPPPPAGSQPAVPGGVPGLGGVPGIPGAPGQSTPMPNGTAFQQAQQQFPQFQQAQQITQNANTPGAGGPPSSAAGLINQILTTPRPGGIPGLPGQGGPVNAQGVSIGGPAPVAAPQQQVIGAGIAGVASKREQEGIKTINDRTKYNEWEFVYDISKDGSRIGGGQPNGGPGGRGTQPNQPGSSPFGVNQGNSPFSPPPPPPAPGR